MLLREFGSKTDLAYSYTLNDLKQDKLQFQTVNQESIVTKRTKVQNLNKKIKDKRVQKARRRVLTPVLYIDK